MTSIELSEAFEVKPVNLECYYCHGSGVRKKPIGLALTLFTLGIINVAEATDPTYEDCPYCAGTGKKRS